ncbi:MAG: hypothetical protein IJK14_02445 [Clostridia bacterium]|nr:hypothetical protein [Clostridia bacterium]
MQSATVKCPHCGKNVDMDPNAENPVCKYCGASLQPEHAVPEKTSAITENDQPEAQTDSFASKGGLAEARYIPNEETYQNMHFLMDIRKNRAIRLGGAGLILISGLQLYLNGPDRKHVIILCLLCMVGFAFIFIGKYYPGFQGKRTYKNLLDKFGGKAHLPCMIQTFYQDRVEVHAEKSENIRTYPYSKVTDIRENANMLVLVFNKTIGIAVPRNAFIKGSAYDVSSLIRSNYKFNASTGLYTPHDVQEIIRKPNM